MNDKYFSDIFGLVTKHDPITENGGLFLAQYDAVEKSQIGLDTFLNKMIAAKESNGLYKRSANHTKRSVSHDEITGMMASSIIHGTDHRFVIWKQLIKNFGAYPAVVMEFSDRLPFNPANYYNWGQYVGSKVSYAFLVFYVINMLLACSKERQDVGSKLIYWLELETMPKNLINNLMKSFFTKKMKAQYGENYLWEMRKVYFLHEDESEFPLFTSIKGKI